MFIYKQLPTEVIALEEENWKQEAYIEGFLIENIALFKKDEDSDARFLERQITIEGKKRIDLLILMFTSKGRTGFELKVVEVKKEKAKKEDLNQLKEYMDIWRKEGSRIVRKEGLIERIEQFSKEKVKIKVRIEDLNETVKGVLIAPDFDGGVRDFINKSKEIEGMEITRQICNKLNESYIFIEYFPTRKAFEQITSEEFWKGPGTKRRDEVEKLLKKIEEEVPGTTHRYYQSMISIYPSEEVIGKERIAKYKRGDKSMLVDTGNKKYIRIDLEKVSEIIEKIKKCKEG